MQFRDVLNRYIEQIGCSAKELSDASRVSPAVISRYRSGERIPSPESPQLLALAEGIAELSRSNPLTMISRDDVYRTFLETISGVSVDYGNFLLNLNQLVKTLGISNTDLAQALLFDPSYISRILAGQRRPADMPQFLKVVSSFAAQRYRRKDAPDALAHLLDCDKHALATEGQCAEAIESWLSTHINPRIDSIAGFMRELDSYDFYEFARSLRTGHIQPQKNSSYLPLSHVYVGPSEIAQSRIDFLKIARDSHANDTVILYSDLPMNKDNQDPEYQKNIIYHLGLLLDRGVEMKIVHDIHRPYDEMIMGLKSMIPAYMTGQISPYYLPHAQNEVFQHFLWGQLQKPAYKLILLGAHLFIESCI
jgi:transcriptional regulator with XRE-family HTH domain